jgi:integrase
VPEISDICVKQPQKPMRILSRQEQQRLSRFLCDEPTPCHLGILLCLYTGLRIGEICALTWGDICIAEKYLYVHQTMQRIQIPGMTGA